MNSETTNIARVCHAANKAWCEANGDQARALFDDLGGASQWKDAKLDWDDEPNV